MKPVVGIFAHPDDEAFGPGGTLAILAKKRDVYLICVTNGDAGMNSSEKKEAILSEIRREELLESVNVLGIKKVFFLDYKDGSLSNNLYHEIAEKIQQILQKLKPEILITHDTLGVTGHLDHIAVSMITTFVFQKLQDIKELWYYCISDKEAGIFKDYFVYFPPGYKRSEVDKIIDISSVWDQRIEAMYKHQTQIHDVKRILKTQSKLPKEDYFRVLKNT